VHAREDEDEHEHEDEVVASPTFGPEDVTIVPARVRMRMRARMRARMRMRMRMRAAGEGAVPRLPMTTRLDPRRPI
jgi:hypothetical protein